MRRFNVNKFFFNIICFKNIFRIIFLDTDNINALNVIEDIIPDDLIIRNITDDTITDSENRGENFVSNNQIEEVDNQVVNGDQEDMEIENQARNPLVEVTNNNITNNIGKLKIN